MKSTKELISVLILLLFISACEDSSTLPFLEEYTVEGYLIVDQPIQNIRITKSQDVTKPFNYSANAVTNVEVKLFVGEGSTVLSLTYVPDASGKTPGGYSYNDTVQKVQPATKYRLEIKTADGKTISATTNTPNRISWTNAPRPVIQFATDTINYPVPDSLILSWTPSGNREEYLISVTSLDTLNYGSYLTPQTSERNRRTPLQGFEEDTPYYNSLTRWGFLQGYSVPTSWNAFKWYGKQTISLYAPDDNFINWFKLTRFNSNPTYDKNLGSIVNGKGVFGSAAVLNSEILLLKNRR